MTPNCDGHHRLCSLRSHRFGSIDRLERSNALDPRRHYLESCFYRRDSCDGRFAVQHCSASASVRGDRSHHHSPRPGRNFCCGCQSACQSGGARMEAAPSERARMRRSGTQGTRPERRGPGAKGSLSQSSQSCRTPEAMRRPGQACDAQLTVFHTGRHFDADLVTNVPYTCLEANEVIESSAASISLGPRNRSRYYLKSSIAARADVITA